MSELLSLPPPRFYRVMHFQNTILKPFIQAWSVDTTGMDAKSETKTIHHREAAQIEHFNDRSIESMPANTDNQKDWLAQKPYRLGSLKSSFVKGIPGSLRGGRFSAIKVRRNPHPKLLRQQRHGTFVKDRVFEEINDESSGLQCAIDEVHDVVLLLLWCRSIAYRDRVSARTGNLANEHSLDLLIS
jgi:hypothetical protein